MITLRLKEAPHVPLETETISPDIMAELSRDEICALPIQLGKRKKRLDDFFEVEGERSDNLEIHGDLHRVKWIGREMSRGKITVHGSVGMHLGAYMHGGEIEVHGNAGDWIGAEMTDGLIRVHGNAGGQIGAAYRGSITGMKNGTIIVDGTAGLEVGMRMLKGTIAIGGVVKDFAGLQMKGGNIVLLSGAEIRTGAWMVRGTIISLAPLKLLPTFSRGSAYNPPHMPLYSQYLAGLGVNIPHRAEEGRYEIFHGDASVPGKGEILIWNAN